MTEMDRIQMTIATTEEASPPSLWEQLTPLVGLAVTVALAGMIMPMTRRVVRGAR